MSSPFNHKSILRDTRSLQKGIRTSVNNIGCPKSNVTNLLAPECILSTTITCCVGVINNCCQGNDLLGDNISSALRTGLLGTSELELLVSESTDISSVSVTIKILFSAY